jgi:hypothetical protein
MAVFSIGIVIDVFVTLVYKFDESNLFMAENPDQISEASRLSPRVRIPNFNLNQEGILNEDLNRLRNSRRGVLSAITVKQNGIVNLLTEDKNLEVVKAKLRDLEELFLKYVATYITAIKGYFQTLKVKKQHNINTKRKKKYAVIS